ncbi:filamentation induced by cAMP protein fic [Oleiphilus messinensis]|uniref:Filamentation induced by cAMP protein fic n=2 Tax=Oleiphilus messinensis TaxID=141451 RepID=A0A1Y0I1V0_9GAMM|nr:filamentation induced by cAMP protein fic [Oleiphilus messinensis]
MIAAIKYQGIRLHFFAAIFTKVDVEELTNFIKGKPLSVYNRVIWYLYEWLTGNELAIDNLTKGNYIKLFDDEYYYTLQEGERDKRTRVINNAIGTREFCPIIRKTPEIKTLEKIDVYDTAYAQMQLIGQNLSADVIGRSINYLYTKETKSSTDIEKETPSKDKMQRFLKAVKSAGQFELNKEKIIDIQNQIVEENKKATDYRDHEIYVGTTIHRLSGYDEDVHYIGPKHEHVASMMKGLLDTHDKLMMDGQVPSLMHATAISFGEVYIHPMKDGNGRIHRYLIHDVMKQRDQEHKFIIPISAAILKNQPKYDEVLESLSTPIMAMLTYELDDDARVIINNDIDYMYRYPDFTNHVIFIYEMMNTAIAEELKAEICLLLAIDKIKGFINERCDVPNNKLDVCVSIIVKGRGKVSKTKRKLVLKSIDESLLEEVEDFASSVLNTVRETLNVDVADVINSP